MASSQYNNDPDPWLRGVSATVEHIEPRAMGGDNSEKNLVAAWHRERLADDDHEGVVELTKEWLDQAGVPTHYLDLHVTIRSSEERLH